jgi:hypothetical protein
MSETEKRVDPGAMRLQPKLIEQTIRQLHSRIDERFPDSGLSRVSLHLLEIARNAEDMSRWLGRPLWAFRLAGAVVIAILIAAIAAQFWLFDWKDVRTSWSEFFQGMDAVTNELLFAGAAIFFLATMERRYKRRKGLEALHTLRSIAHIIDMHQLTKDPERVRPAKFTSTPSSPHPDLSGFHLRRYLDYCSELLSLTGKIAAEYVNQFDDATLVSAVNEIETLTSDMSRKIWQKIMIVYSFESDAAKIASAPRP